MSDLTAHYEALEMTQKEIQTLTVPNLSRIYKACARKWHPDKNPICTTYADQRMKEINGAYQALRECFELGVLPTRGPPPAAAAAPAPAPAPQKTRTYAPKETANAEEINSILKNMKKTAPPAAAPSKSAYITTTETLQIMAKIESQRQQILGIYKCSLFEQYLLIALKIALVNFQNDTIKQMLRRNVFVRIPKIMWQNIAKIWFGYRDNQVRNATIEGMLNAEYYIDYIVTIGASTPKLLAREVWVYANERKKQLDQMLHIMTPTNPHRSTIALELAIMEHILEFRQPTAY